MAFGGGATCTGSYISDSKPLHDGDNVTPIGWQAACNSGSACNTYAICCSAH
jgi:hypothetical protein